MGEGGAQKRRDPKNFFESKAMSHSKSLAQTPADLKLESYFYDLPPELIAERPVAGRHHSRLLVYDEATDSITHATFKDLPKFMPENSTLVMNQSRVFPCRLLGSKSTGAKVEVLLLKASPDESGLYPALIRTGSKKKEGDLYHFSAGLTAEILQCLSNGTFLLKFNRELTSALLEEVALVPIPPYIRDGVSDKQDLTDYQTVYAKAVGSVAAPTAGLHFTDELFSELDQMGVSRNFVTLHVGIGTFAPVKSEVITDHQMHFEEFYVDQSDLKAIRAATKTVAVGTTTLRVLESIHNQAYTAGELSSTNIFLHPGVEVHSIDGLITNFHLPKSTLLMLVSALIGREKTLALYNEAVAQGYRFFSYGDAMFIRRKSL